MTSMRPGRDPRCALIFPADSITDADDFADRRAIFDCLDHVVGHVRARDFETEEWQVAFARAILPVYGLSVSSGGRTIVHSRLLSAKMHSIADASATVRGNRIRPRKQAGGMIEFLNRKAG
jgi:hypothetical protein